MFQAPNCCAFCMLLSHKFAGSQPRYAAGGVIFFDLLAAEDLSFRPRALITLGAPTALFLHCAQAGETREDARNRRIAHCGEG